MLPHETALPSDITQTSDVIGMIVYVTTAEAALHHNKASKLVQLRMRFWARLLMSYCAMF